jgi:uncharacterized protein GlcG (DUF336 family)
VIGLKLTLAKAEKMLKTAKAKAKEIGIPMSIAIVDDGAHLVAFERMDGAQILSIQVAQDKATTAAAIGMPTHELGPMSAPGGPAYGLAAYRNVVVFGGGFPIKLKGVLVGGIGASGGPVEKDMEVARAALSAVKAD